MPYLSLLEAAKLQAPSRTMGVIEHYSETSQVLTVAPVMRSNGLDKWTLEGKLPFTTSATATRAMDSDFTSLVGTAQPYSSETKIYGGKIQYDGKLETETPDAVVYQERLRIKALARQFTIDFFEGTGGLYLTGLRTILENFEDFDAQTVNAASSNTATITLDMLDEVLSKINKTNLTFIYANDSIIRTINSLSRAPVSGSFGIDRTMSQFGMYSETYKGIPLVPMMDGEGADMLSTTEADADANETDAKSLYVVTYGPENVHLHASNGNTGSYPFPTVEVVKDGTNFRTSRLDWYVGLSVKARRSIARIRYLS